MPNRRNQITILALLLAWLAFGCAVMEKDLRSKSASRIVEDLESRARTIRSYGLSHVIRGKTIKRMYFEFERSGKPFFRFRSDFIRAGKRYVYIYNADGRHDYHYFPDEGIAYRCPTDGGWNKGNYDRARAAHFDYQGATVEGETVIDGRACYLMKFKNHWIAVWKEKGIIVATLNRPDDKENAIYYENITFDLPEDTFTVPAGARIVDRKNGFFNPP